MLALYVCRIDQITDEPQSFEVEGVEVPVLAMRVDGQIIAGTSMCPHEDVSLTEGCIRDGSIVCSAHGYSFDLQTGDSSHDPDLRWRRYKTIERDGELWVDLVSQT